MTRPNSFDTIGTAEVVKTIRFLAEQPSLFALRDVIADAADDIERRHSNDRNYATLRLGLRNAIARQTSSSPDYCPSQIYRDIEAGAGALEAADKLNAIFQGMADKTWLDGVEGTALALLSEAG